MLQTTLGTGFAPNTSGAILVLEDRGMKPYQVDRALRHLYQAGIFEKVAGILLGAFPDVIHPPAAAPSFRDLRGNPRAARCAHCLRRSYRPHQAPYTHIPLGVRAKLHAKAKACWKFSNRPLSIKLVVAGVKVGHLQLRFEIQIEDSFLAKQNTFT